MRILIWHNFYSEEGGENSVFRQECDLLQQHGHEVRIFKRDSKILKDMGLLERSRTFVASFFSLKTYLEVRAYAKKFKTHVAIVQNVYPLISPSVYYALHAEGIPVTQTVYNYRSYCVNGQLYTKGKICERCAQGSMLNSVRYACLHQNRWLSLWYAAVIGLHRYLRILHFVAYFIVPHRFVGYRLESAGIPAEKIRANPNPFVMPAKADPSMESPYILFVGRVVREKGVLTLVNAMRLVDSTIRLVIVGDGEAMPELRLILDRDEHLKGRIELKGSIWGEPVRELFGRATIFVLPSERYDPSPIVLYTALSMGNPSLVGGLGGAAEIVEDGVNGLCFEAGNTLDLASKLNVLIADEPLRARLSSQARERALSEFNEAAHYQSLHEYLLESIEQAS
jgi:glycosyltransferase involved in cell wall biosynthesis